MINVKNFTKHLFQFTGTVKRKQLLIAIIGWYTLLTIYSLSAWSYIQRITKIYEEKQEIAKSMNADVDLDAAMNAIHHLNNANLLTMVGILILFLSWISLSAFKIRRLRDANLPIWLWFPQIFMYLLAFSAIPAVLLEIDTEFPLNIMKNSIVKIVVPSINMLSLLLTLALLIIPTRKSMQHGQL